MATALELLLSVGPVEPGTKVGIVDAGGREWTVEFGEVTSPDSARP
jgi:hypothetical protein